MIRNLLTAFLAIATIGAAAAPGDTTIVTVHNAVDMTWYGPYDQWGEFPQGGPTYRKVILHYAMGCASTGCSGWDYTTQIKLRHRPENVWDTTWAQAPSFTLEGAMVDSVAYTTTPTFLTSWNGTTTDTLWLDLQTITYFNNPDAPLIATDSIEVYPAGFYYMVFDENGLTTDSVFVSPENTIFPTYTPYYTVAQHIDEYELARAITPYGTYMNPANNGYGTNGYNASWVQDFYFDVTDYQHLLQGDVELRAFYSGWSSGFSATLKFIFIEGVPPYNVLRLSNLYNSDYNYTSATDFNTNQLADKPFDILSNATGVVARVIVTGHGQDGEFTNNVKYFVRANNNTVAQQTIWKNDCGKNALWPQGGTWVYNRANWCPGEAIRVFNHNITPNIITGQTNVLDVNFSSYTPANGASYTFTTQIIEHAGPNFNLDAEVADIIAPSLADEHSRKNPICANPIIRIRNTGGTDLTSLRITYGVRGAAQQTFDWTGLLKFTESEEVTLPVLNDWNGSALKFDVSISSPNGGQDNYAFNNGLSSEFALPEVITGTPGFEVSIKTNSYGFQNYWKLFDVNGNIIAQREGMNNNTTYKDTVVLASGCYKLVLTDQGNDGLQWWANPNQGSGWFRLKKLGETAIFKNFLTDFGTETTYTFNFQSPDGIAVPGVQAGVTVFPNPTNGRVAVAATSPLQKVVVVDMLGRDLVNHATTENRADLDLGHLNPGIYFIRATLSNGSVRTIRTVLQ